MKRVTLTLLAVTIFLLVGCTVTVKPEQKETIVNPSSSFEGLLQYPSDNSSTGGFDEDEIKDMSNEKIECADSYITDVYSKVSMNKENKMEKAEYKIIQGKDGTKYSAELSYDSKEYTYSFTINDESGINLLSLTTYASYYGDVFRILDLNMDGYADIQFLTGEGTMNSVYDFYIWNAAARKFVKAECEDELLFIELEINEGYIRLRGRNDSSSGIITEYKWEGNKMIKVSVDEYHADDEDSAENSDWRFTQDDIKINDKIILGITYEELLRTFGNPVETKTYKINPPATEPDYFEYIYVCVYDGFECEFFTGQNEKIPEPADTVFRFDITNQSAHLECELYIGIDKDELDLRYDINKIYRLNDAENYDLSNIQNVLWSYKPEGYYADYEKAAIVYHDVNSFEEPLAKALVLLFDDDMGYDTDRVQRIVFGYPTAN